MRILVNYGNEDRTMNNSTSLTEPRAGNKSGVSMRILQIIVRIAIIISLAELFIMQVFAVALHDLGVNAEALLDAALLVVLSTPFIYGWVIKPYVFFSPKGIDDMRGKLVIRNLATVVPKIFTKRYTIGCK